MTDRSYKFVILRFTPDVRRGESVNVGLAVLNSVRPDVRILPSLAKVQALDGNVDLRPIFDLEVNIPLALASMADSDQLEVLKELGFASDRDVGEFVARDSTSYQAAVSELMRKLVSPVRRRTRHLRDTRISTDLRNSLSHKGLMGRTLGDIEKHKVVSHYPISEQLDLYADFALKNGVLSVIKTIDFRVQNAASAEKFREACAVSFSFIKAKEEEKDARRLVVYAADVKTEAAVDRHISVLSDDAEYVLNYESVKDRRFLMDEIEKITSGQTSLH